MTKAIRVERDIPMKMRDGITLRADVFRPDDRERHPAIIVRTPYNKTRSGASDFLAPVDAAFAGYALVVQDTRGRFSSEGEFSPGRSEGQDGYDTIENIAAESWCDGNVGMVGASYLGRNQWDAAQETPPHLKAIAPHVIGAGMVSESGMSGVKELETGISWFATMALDMVEKMARQGKDVSGMLDNVRYAMTHFEEVCNFLPLKDIPYFKFEGLQEGFMRRFSDDQLREKKSEEELFWAYEKIKVPCLQSAGWYDMSVAHIFLNFSKMKEKGGSPLAREGQHMIIGPWVHGARLHNFIGALNFGAYGSGAGAFMINRHIGFFDKYLRGIDSKYLVPIRYFVMGRNRWKNAETWPLPETQWQRFFLHSRGHANTAGGDGVLGREEPGRESPDIFVYNPLDPVPTRGGRLNPDLNQAAGPQDQSIIEKRNDVLCYTTPELKEELEISGPLKLHLFASTSAVDTDFFVKLVDLYPNGLAVNVAEGAIRARYRKSILNPQPVVPGEINEYEIDLASTSNVFGRGHRIRIDVTSSNFPRFDRNMNTGNPFGEDALGLPAMQTIFHQSGQASYIDLPVIPVKG
jgi:putative CocE/NonD family hydrolase